jgi:4-amino-4-deoxy-L-arabinose transferase-like glycosyltransferase
VWRAIVLLLLASLTFVAGLGGPAITDSDEAFYAEAAREMVATGDWITPHFNDQERFQKPILYYWLTAATYTVAGVSETTARLWSALSGIGLVFIAFGAGRRWYGDGPGSIAGAITATSFGVFWMARQALPDLPVTFFMTVATWAAIEAVTVEAGTREPGQPAGSDGATRRKWLLLSAAAMALGLLTKGPVAVVLPIGIAVLVVLWEHRGRRGEQWLAVGATDLALASLVLVVIAAPWFVAVTLAHGVEYLVRFFVGENVERFATSRFNEPRSIFFYVPIVLGGLVPWTSFLLLWIAPLTALLRGRRRLMPSEARLGLWAVVPFVFYSISMGKQPRYVLPCLTPVAILLGASLWRYLRPDRPAPRDALWTTAAVTMGAIVMLVGVLVLRAGAIMRAVDPAWSAAGPYVMIGCGVVAIGAALTLPPRIALPTLTAAAAATLFALQASVLWLGRPEPVEVVAGVVRAQGHERTVCTCGAFTRNLVFYSHHPTLVGETDEDAQRLLEQADPALVVLDEPMLARIERATGRTFVRLADVSYLNTNALRADDLLHPDAARKIQRILLVSNR